MRRTVRTAFTLIAVLAVLGIGVQLFADSVQPTRGNAPFRGSARSLRPHAAVVDVIATDSGKGYWLVSADGGVFTFGDAPFLGSLGDLPLQAPVIDATTRNGGGYWLVSSDGGVFSFGDAPFFGAGFGRPHLTPFTAIAATTSGKGYWLLTADGGVFTFGDAPFLGNAFGLTAGSRAVSIAASPTGAGYWISTAAGAVFSFGDAEFHGSLVGLPLQGPITKMTPRAGGGYWLVSADGGVFSLGAPMYGAAPDVGRADPTLAIAASPQGDGYWIATAGGGVVTFDRRGRAGDFSATPTPANPNPGPGNLRVGPSNPGAMRSVGFVFDISQPGAVVENIDVWGAINIRASNVTVRNFRAAQVNIESYANGTVLEDGEVHGYNDPNFGGDGVSYGRYTARRLNVHNTYDGFKANGDVIIEQTWVHDLNARFGPGVGTGGYTHNDAVQVSAGSHIWLHDNRFERVGNNAAVFIDADQAPINDVTVERNFLEGGGITLYSIQSRSAPWFGVPTNVTIRDNVFGWDHKFDFALLGGGAGWERNVTPNGQPIQPKRE
ncbi:MAG: hypothetical protein ACOYNI_05230 [Acidimicrobiia bacterium]